MSKSARGRAQADAQSRCDGAGSGVIGSDPRQLRRCEGLFLSEIILVKSPERRLWASKREDRRALFARRSLLSRSLFSTGRIGNGDRLSQRRGGLFKEAFHPAAPLRCSAARLARVRLLFSGAVFSDTVPHSRSGH